MQELVRKKMGARRAIILLGVAMAVLFLASALVSTEPSAQTTSPEGKIVYVKQGTEPSEHCDEQHACDDIWVMDADGTNQTNLTNTPDTNEGQPAWSPDGTKIAFTGPGDLNEDGVRLGDIYVMDADGTNRTNLTDTPNRSDYQPSWAPSGAQLTFVRVVEGRVFLEQPDIFVMDTDPATKDDAINLTQTDESEYDPAWSPDGAKIAFAGVRNSGWEIVTMDPDGQNEKILTGDGFDGNDEAPDWSPDGTKVVFMKESQVGGCCEPWEIWAVNRDGSGDTNLTNDPSYDMGPSWSPDGSEITFSSTRARTDEDPSRTDIYAMPAPTTLPPPSETAATTTMEQGEGVMAFAESTLIRRLTTGGLSSEPDWADTPADTQAPRVSSTFPAAGATEIGPGVNVKATFSEAMRATSINTNTVKLFRAGTTTPIVAVVSYDTQTKTATLNPNANLRSGLNTRLLSPPGRGTWRVTA